jgi:hypothetical protein
MSDDLHTITGSGGGAYMANPIPMSQVTGLTPALEQANTNLSSALEIVSKRIRLLEWMVLLLALAPWLVYGMSWWLG